MRIPIFEGAVTFRGLSLWSRIVLPRRVAFGSLLVWNAHVEKAESDH